MSSWGTHRALFNLNGPPGREPGGRAELPDDQTRNAQLNDNSLAAAIAPEFCNLDRREFEGNAILDTRVNFTNKDGQLQPTRKGLSIGVRRLPELAAAIAKTEAKARELGLLDQAVQS